MRRRWLGLFFAILVLSAEWAYSQQRAAPIGIGEQARFEFELRRWRPRFGSEIKVGGDSIDPKEDLGWSDPRDFEYTGFLRLGRWIKIRGSGTLFKFEAAKTLEREISYGGATFQEGTTVASNMDLAFYKAGVEVEVFKFREGFISFFADYSVFEAEPIIESTEEGIVNAGKQDIKLPTFGTKIRFYLTPALAITLEGEGMKKDGTGVITDWYAAATYSLGNNFAVSFGYRNLYAKWLKGR
jgi:hypothetical protein